MVMSAPVATSDRQESSVLGDVSSLPRESVRKQTIRQHANAIAAQRDAWIQRNRSYYEADRTYMRFLIPEGARVLDIGCGTGDLLSALKPSFGVGIDLGQSMVDAARAKHPDLDFRVGDGEDADFLSSLPGPFDVIILSDTIGLFDDIETALTQLHSLCTAETRIVIAYHSQSWEPLLKFAQTIGRRMPQPPLNYLSQTDFFNILELADMEPISFSRRQLAPFDMFGIGSFINRYIAPLPLFNSLCLRRYVVARSKRAVRPRDYSVTVLVPCRNERGNIEDAVRRMPRFGSKQEILFVEGNSRDDTYEECLRVRDAYAGTWNIRVLQQTGKGKGDAVRRGFDAAEGEVLMILDADLTMPPEALPKFYAAIASGKGEFINGTRLVYPMEDGAMRGLNLIANRAFASIFSYLINQRFSDTLCGTKVLRKTDYEKIVAGRSYFGDFDPFGDFDLILGAAKQNLRIIEIPIHYAARTYGETQISRFRDGLMLLRMVVFAFGKLKAI